MEESNHKKKIVKRLLKLINVIFRIIFISDIFI